MTEGLNAKVFQVLHVSVGTKAQDAHTRCEAGLHSHPAILNYDAPGRSRSQLLRRIQEQIRAGLSTSDHVGTEDSSSKLIS